VLSGYLPLPDARPRRLTGARLADMPGYGASVTSTPNDPWGVPSPASSPPGPVTPGPPTDDPFSGDPFAQNPFAPAPSPPAAYPPAAYEPPPASGGPAGDPVPLGQVIVQVGEIGVTSSTVHTPAGDIPLKGSTWQVSDYWHHEQRIPQWAIVAAILGFCVLTVFSLLFLLVKETISHGTVQVTVTNGTRQYVARIPVTDQNQVTYFNQQVNYIRSLAAL
jgi:hypothetical protein